MIDGSDHDRHKTARSKLKLRKLERLLPRAVRNSLDAKNQRAKFRDEETRAELDEYRGYEMQ